MSTLRSTREISQATSGAYAEGHEVTSIGGNDFLRTTVFRVFELVAAGMATPPIVAGAKMLLLVIQILGLSFWHVTGGYWVNHSGVRVLEIVAFLGVTTEAARSLHLVIVFVCLCVPAFGILVFMLAEGFFYARYRRLPK
jgi:hypothetical protein